MAPTPIPLSGEPSSFPKKLPHNSRPVAGTRHLAASDLLSVLKALLSCPISACDFSDFHVFKHP